MPATQVMGRGFSLKKYYKLNEKMPFYQCNPNVTQSPTSLIENWGFFMYNELIDK